MSKTMTDDNPTDKPLISAFVSFTKTLEITRVLFIHRFLAVDMVDDNNNHIY